MSDIVLQEKHSTGHLWWKITGYRYYRYFEGSMLPVRVYPAETIKHMENK